MHPAGVERWRRAGRAGPAGRLRWPFAVLFLALAVSVAPAASGGVEQARQRLARGESLRVVCFGDSITGVYYHTGGRLAWSHLLEGLLRAAHPRADVKMLNAGVSGNTTAAALERMERDVLSRSPDLVVIMFGMNDVVRIPPETFAANLTSLVQRARERGMEVVLATPNAVQDGDADRPRARVASYAEIVRRVGLTLGVPVADCFQRFASLAAGGGYAWTRIMSDAVHPNLHGHRLIAQEVAAAVLGRSAAGDEPRWERAVPWSRAQVKAGRPVRVLAMTPWDAVLRERASILTAGSTVEVQAWPVAGRTFSAVVDDARQWGRWRTPPHAGRRPDLIVLEMRMPERAAADEAWFAEATRLVNATLSFGPAQWDVLPVLLSQPSGYGETIDQRWRAVVRDVLHSKGIAPLELEPGDSPAAGAQLAAFLRRAWE
jgi:lysophospholipase L1-like esterase